MTRLSEILDQMTTVLNDLKMVMDAEQQQLSVGQINGSQLQRITEEKLVAGDAGLSGTTAPSGAECAA